MPDIDLGIRETAVNKSKSLLLEGLNSGAGERGNKQISG